MSKTKCLLPLLLFIFSQPAFAFDFEPGIWTFQDKSNGSARTVELLIESPLSFNKYSVAISSDPLNLKVVGIKLMEKNLLVLLLVSDQKKGPNGFIRKYYSILKNDKSKFALGKTKHDLSSGKPTILFDSSSEEIAMLTKSN